MADGWTIRGEKIQRHGRRGVNCEARERKIGGRGQGEGEGEGEKWARSPVGHREDTNSMYFLQLPCFPLKSPTSKTHITQSIRHISFQLSPFPTEIQFLQLSSLLDYYRVFPTGDTARIKKGICFRQGGNI